MPSAYMGAQAMKWFNSNRAPLYRSWPTEPEGVHGRETPLEGPMQFLREIVNWLKALEIELPQILGAAELILVKVSLFGIFLYGLWRLLIEVLNAHH